MRRKRKYSRRPVRKKKPGIKLHVALWSCIFLFVMAGCQLSLRFTSSHAPNAMGHGISDYSIERSADATGTISEAERWLGTPYRYGGNNSSGIDCSGFVCRVYESLGKKLPRTAAQQYEYTTQVPESQRQPGDLVFFRKGGRIYHVGIYSGGDEMIHASSSRGVIRESLEKSHLENNIAGYGRVIL